MINVASITRTTSACPAQWEGLTDDGKDVYVRYRSGWLSIEVGDVEEFCDFIGEDQNDEEELARMKRIGMSDEHLSGMKTTFETMRKFGRGPLCFDGYMEFEELKEATLKSFAWPENEV